MADGSKHNKHDKPYIQIPKNTTIGIEEHQDGEQNPITPKTPADEGINFFQAEVSPGEEPIRVYELRLDPDGGPSKELSVRSWIHLQYIFNPLSKLMGSISDFHPHTRLMYFVFPFKQGLLLQKMACLKRISP